LKKLDWSLEEIPLKTKFTWRISRLAINEKTNFCVRVSDGEIEGLGEISASSRYGESLDLIRTQFQHFIKELVPILPMDRFEEFATQLYVLDLCNSLKFGVESAFTHYLAQKKGVDTTEFLGLSKRAVVPTSFSVPIMSIDELEVFVPKYRRFPSLKVKVEKKTAVDTLKQISSLTDQPLRVDANESWQSAQAVLEFLEECKEIPIEFIEQPMPAKYKDEYKKLKSQCDIPLIADESIEDEADFEVLAEQFHGINVKLMKAGGYQNAICLLDKARSCGMQTMLGCMIETSLGIMSAMNISDKVNYLDLDGFLLIEEDPFQLVKEQDGLLSL
jgi:L-alanine-DL-glutamate epimerase-like enolase superfamily enzyme